MSQKMLPDSQLVFLGWQKNFITQLLLIYVMLGISESAKTALIALQTAFSDAWVLGGPTQKSTRSAAEVQAKNDAMKAYKKGLRDFIAAYLNFNPLLTNSQRTLLGLPIHKIVKSKHEEGTKNTVVFTNKSFGAGVIKTECHSSGTQKLNPIASTDTGSAKKTMRPSKEMGYDVQMSSIIINIGDDLPTNADADEMEKIIKTKATFTRNFGTIFRGKLLCDFARWYNTKHPNIAGPWGELVTTVIT